MDRVTPTSNASSDGAAARRLLTLVLVVVALVCAGSCQKLESNGFADAGGDTLDAVEATSPQARVTPSSGPVSGYYPVTIELGDDAPPAVEIIEVRLGAHPAFGLTVLDARRLAVTVQGSAQGGPVDLELRSRDGAVVVEDAFEYEAPDDPRLRTVVAMGASLTQGVQNGVPTFRGGMMSPIAQLARQAGFYFPLPLVVPGFLPQIGPDDIGPPPECVVPDAANFVAKRSDEVFVYFLDGLDTARVDPDITPYNVAIGGSNVANLLRPPADDDIGVIFGTRVVLDPYEDGDAPQSQIAAVEALEPTLIMITDLYGNDVIGAFVGADVIDPALVTPRDDFVASLETLLERLDATGAYVFIATVPQPSLLPATTEKRQAMIAAAVEAAREAGEDETLAAADAAAEADAAIAAVDAIAAEYNDILRSRLDRYDTMFVVDVAAPVDLLTSAGGIIVGETELTAQKFGGILSYDGVHFTDTGYALLANLFIDALNLELGLDIERIELAEVLADDPGSPAAMTEAGFDPTACVR